MTNRMMMALALALGAPLGAAEQIPADLHEAIRLRSEAVSKKDAATWDRLTMADFTTVLEDGRLQTKAERLAQLKGEKPEPATKPLQERFARYADTVVYRSQRQDGSWVMTVWVKDGQAWRAAAVQATAVSAAERGGPPDAPPPARAVRVGGEIKEPRKLTNVSPVYPEVAKQARVQGVVVLECTISPEGKVTDVKVLRGIPLLDDAAIEAVRQWVYTPTLFHGVPVPVIMTVTVNFLISQ